MARTPVDIIPSQSLTTVAVNYYTVPNAKTAIIKRISFTNVSSGVVTITLYKVGSGDAPTTTNIIAKEKPIDVNETWSCPDIEGKVLETGDAIQALASANTAVNIDGSATEVI